MFYAGIQVSNPGFDSRTELDPSFLVQPLFNH